MILRRSPRGADILELDFRGEITASDYRDVLIPAVQESVAAHGPAKVLARIDPSFERYTLRAALADAEYGMANLDAFDRVAVVGEPGWLATVVQAFAPFLPCPVQIFPLARIDEARRWLRESLGTIHRIDLGGGALELRLLGKLDAAVYAAEADDLAAFLDGSERFRLLLDLRDFDGFRGVSAIAAHLRLMRDNRHLLDRAAIVGHGALPDVATRLAAELMPCEARCFAANEFERAAEWIREAA